MPSAMQTIRGHEGPLSIHTTPARHERITRGSRPLPSPFRVTRPWAIQVGVDDTHLIMAHINFGGPGIGAVGGIS